MMLIALSMMAPSVANVPIVFIWEMESVKMFLNPVMSLIVELNNVRSAILAFIWGMAYA